MITLDEKVKKALTIVGVILALLILWGILNLFTGNTKRIMPSPMGGFSMDDTDSSFGVAPMMDYEIDSSEMAMKNAAVESIPETPALIDKKIIKNGSLSLKVEKTEKAAEEISQIVKNEGGEVFSSNFYERIKGQKSGSITIKVPVIKFEETIGKIKEVATQVVSESTSGQDVTEEFIDLQAQLKNKKAEEESFVKILNRAVKIEDVLAVTQQISRVRGEIESLEGRIKYINSQADMSTITVDLSEDVEITPISNDWRPWQVVKKSFSELIDSMQGLINGLIRFVIVVLPSLIVFLLIVWIFWKIGKKIFNKVFKK